MQTTYKGFSIEAVRGNTADGPSKTEPLGFQVFRKSDGYVLTSGYDYETNNVRDLVSHLKGIVEDYINDPSAYDNGDFNDDLPPDDYEPEIDEDAEPLEAEENEGGVGQ